MKYVIKQYARHVQHHKEISKYIRFQFQFKTHTCWALCFLSLFHLRILITPLVSETLLILLFKVHKFVPLPFFQIILRYGYIFERT